MIILTKGERDEHVRSSNYYRDGVLGFMTMSTACYGPFNLTKNVYHWNSTVKGSDQNNEKWMKEFVFFGVIVVPVYMFSALLMGSSSTRFSFGAETTRLRRRI